MNGVNVLKCLVGQIVDVLQEVTTHVATSEVLGLTSDAPSRIPLCLRPAMRHRSLCWTSSYLAPPAEENSVVSLPCSRRPLM